MAKLYFKVYGSDHSSTTGISLIFVKSIWRPRPRHSTRRSQKPERLERKGAKRWRDLEALRRVQGLCSESLGWFDFDREKEWAWWLVKTYRRQRIAGRAAWTTQPIFCFFSLRFFYVWSGFAIDVPISSSIHNRTRWVFESSGTIQQCPQFFLSRCEVYYWNNFDWIYVRSRNCLEKKLWT